MDEVKALQEVMGREPSKNEIATHFADRISALDRIRRGLLADGEVGLALEVGKERVSLRQEAREVGLSKEEFPGLYR